jgi:hypothetical protein
MAAGNGSNGIIELRAIDAPPLLRCCRDPSPLAQALLGLSIGDFVFSPTDKPRSVAATANSIGRRHGRRFSSRKMMFRGVAGVGIWYRGPARPTLAEVDDDWSRAVSLVAAEC